MKRHFKVADYDSTTRDTPEHRLCAGMILCALDDFRGSARHPGIDAHRRPAFYRQCKLDACCYMLADSDEPMGWKWVCSHLGLDSKRVHRWIAHGDYDHQTASFLRFCLAGARAWYGGIDEERAKRQRGYRRKPEVKARHNSYCVRWRLRRKASTAADGNGSASGTRVYPNGPVAD